MKQYSVTQYAKQIKRTRQRVLQMIDEKKLKAKRIGRIWVIEK